LDPANLNRFEQIKNPMIEKEISENPREMGPKKKNNRKRRTSCSDPPLCEENKQIPSVQQSGQTLTRLN